MATSKWARLISNAVYGVGLAIFLVLAGLVLFGGSLIPDPDAMIAWSMQDYAFVGLAVGTIPMILVCMAVYKFNGIKQHLHRRRDFLLVFAPGFLCGACLLATLGLLVVMIAEAMLQVGGVG